MVLYGVVIHTLIHRVRIFGQKHLVEGLRYLLDHVDARCACLLDGQLDILRRELQRLPKLHIHEWHDSLQTSRVVVRRTDLHRLAHDVETLLLDITLPGGRCRDLGPKRCKGTLLGKFLDLDGLICDLHRRVFVQCNFECLLQGQHQGLGRLSGLLSNGRHNGHARHGAHDQRASDFSHIHLLSVVFFFVPKKPRAKIRQKNGISPLFPLLTPFFIGASLIWVVQYRNSVPA